MAEETHLVDLQVWSIIVRLIVSSGFALETRMKAIGQQVIANSGKGALVIWPIIFNFSKYIKSDERKRSISKEPDPWASEKSRLHPSFFHCLWIFISFKHFLKEMSPTITRLTTTNAYKETGPANTSHWGWQPSSLRNVHLLPFPALVPISSSPLE